MLQQSCNHVTGDDTNEKGFKLIVDDPDDKECDCQLVRSIGGGRNTRVRLNNNILVVDVLRDTPTPTGGGLITVNLVINTDPTRIPRILSFFWSEPIIIVDDDGNSIEVPMKRMTNVNFDSFFVYGADTSVFTEGVSARGIPMRPHESLFILDPPLSITFPPGRIPTPVTVTSRLVRVADSAMVNWRNQRIFTGNTYLLAAVDSSVEGNEGFRWIPHHEFFQASQNYNSTTLRTYSYL